MRISVQAVYLRGCPRKQQRGSMNVREEGEAYKERVFFPQQVTTVGEWSLCSGRPYRVPRVILTMGRGGLDGFCVIPTRTGSEEVGSHPPNPRPLGEGCFQGIRVHPASRAELGFKPGLAPQSMPWRKLWRVIVTPSESCSVTFWLERLHFLIFMLGMVIIPTS